MGRVLGEVMVLLLVLVLGIAIIVPALQVAHAGGSATPYDEALLVLGMVFGLMAPITYFAARSWWTRGLGVLFAAFSALCVAIASYMFESHRSIEGVAALACLAVMVLALERYSRYRSEKRRKSLDALEALVMFEIAQAVREYVGEDGVSTNFVPVMSLARQMAQSEAWAAIHEANSVDEARMRLDRALASLQHDLHDNPTIDSASTAAQLVGLMRSRLSRLSSRALGRGVSRYALV